MSAPAKPSPASAELGAKRRDLFATVVTVAIGAPLLFLFAFAMREAEQHRAQEPVRQMIGDDAYEANLRGEKTELHYFGDGLLAPDFTLPDQHGKPWRLQEKRGKVVVLNVWSITCQPCVEEMPSLITLADIARKRKDIEVVAISTDKDWASVSTIFPPNSRLKVLFDPERKVVRDMFGSKLYPETWVIDPGGVIRLRVDGPRDWKSALALDALERFL
jgi:peroxiredoxin